MSNRDLLKEAIADAKAVKEMAISNAKAALEEAFTPQLKSMLEKKLTEMDKEDEHMEEAMHDEEKMEEKMHDDKTMSEEELEEILAELEEGDEKEHEMEEAKDHEEKMEEADDKEEMHEEEEEPEADEEEKEEEEFDLEEMSEEDLKAFIEDVVDEMIEAGELEAGEEEMEAPEMEAPEEVTDEESEEIEEPMMENKEQVNEILGVTAATLGIAKLALPVVAALGGYITKQYLSFKKDKAKQEEFKKRMEAAAKPDMSKEELKALADKITAELGGRGEGAEKAGPEFTGGAGGATTAIQREGEDADEMHEALETIETLKAELNEVNLLNSKLLYTNKIFKAKNLSEAQKVKVLTTFDKAESVKEVKLVYETLLEGLVSTTSTAKEAIKESKSFASKAVGTSPKKPVVETDGMVSRFQKLAGIK